VAVALNGGRPLGGVEGDDDEKLCEGKPKKGTCGWLWRSTEEGRWEGWRATATRSCVRKNKRREPMGGCGAQRRKSVGGYGAQRRKAVGRGGGQRCREAV